MSNDNDIMTVNELQKIYQRAAFEEGHKHQDQGHRGAILAIFEEGIGSEQQYRRKADTEAWAAHVAETRQRVMRQYRRMKREGWSGHGMFLYGAAVALNTTAYDLLNDDAEKGGQP